jgi:predicted DCC family thiol-disulfide oxidoreductase YuxK
MDTLYYDGNCPLCLREIRALQKLRDERLQLVDIHSYNPAPGEPARESMLLRLHLRTADGGWLSGVDATVKAWSHTRWGFLSRPLRWPLLTPLADRAYDYWARRRFDGLYCHSGCVQSVRSDMATAAQKLDHSCIFRASLADLEFAPEPESKDVCLFAEQDIP